MSAVRVRFAPSPTGSLHIGSARTALFNWLYARHTKGQFILRIEDTDAQRSKSEFLDEILGSLKWLGLDWDEGPIFQSQRFDRYRAAAEQLLASGAAYQDGPAIIYRVTAGETLRFPDLVHGQIAVESQTIKDQVLLKSDGTPAYNFACVIDDADLKITHVIRGDDHISNTPKQLLLYRALKLIPPQFAHIPLILGEDRSRMSKRHGATAIAEYRRAGYLPDALVNFISLLGWSPGDDREILPREELVALFDLPRVGCTGAIFNLDKLDWMNGEYLKRLPPEALVEQWLPLLTEQGRLPAGVTSVTLEPIVKLFHGRVTSLDDFLTQAGAFHQPEVVFDPAAVEQRLKAPGVLERLSQFADRLVRLETWEAAAIEACCRQLAQELGAKAAELIHPTRGAVTGRSVGPSLFHALEVIGQVKAVQRLRQAAQGLATTPSSSRP